jgi:hypothetical protein
MTLIEPLPPMDMDTLLWICEYKAEHGENPRVTEIPSWCKESVGAYAFALADWRDEQEREWCDDLCYQAALYDYSLRPPPDYDTGRHCRGKHCYRYYHPAKESPKIKNRYDLCPHCRENNT